MGKPLRNESIPGAREMWEAVDRAAAKCPEWLKKRMDELLDKSWPVDKSPSPISVVETTTPADEPPFLAMASSIIESPPFIELVHPELLCGKFLTISINGPAFTFRLCECMSEYYDYSQRNSIGSLPPIAVQVVKRYIEADNLLIPIGPKLYCWYCNKELMIVDVL